MLRLRSVPDPVASPSPVDLKFDLGLPSYFERVLKKWLGLTRLQQIYAQVQSLNSPDSGSDGFCRTALRELQVQYGFSGFPVEELKSLKGPVVFVANHPYGAIDALILVILMSEARTDFRLMTNWVVSAIPELKPVLVPVSIMRKSLDRPWNVKQLKLTLNHLACGGTLGLFPGGEVAAVKWTSLVRPVESSWHPHLAKIVKRSKATVVPVYFDGQNSATFQYLGLIVPFLRIALLARELAGGTRKVNVRIGQPVIFGSGHSELGLPPDSSFYQKLTLDLASE